MTSFTITINNFNHKSRFVLQYLGNSLCTRKHTLSQIQHQRKEAKNLCVDNSPLEVSQYKSFNYSSRSNTKPPSPNEKGDRSLASTKQADFECDTQLNDQSV